MRGSTHATKTSGPDLLVSGFSGMSHKENKQGLDQQVNHDICKGIYSWVTFQWLSVKFTFLLSLS